MPAAQQEVEPQRAPSRQSKDNEPKEQVEAATLPIDRVLWFEDNDIFRVGILPFLNLRDLGPFARTCKRAYAAVTRSDGKSKGTSCLLTLVPLTRPYLDDYDPHNHPIDDWDFDARADVILIEENRDAMTGEITNRHKIEKRYWRIKAASLPCATVLRPHGISRVSVAVEHEAKTKSRTDISIKEGAEWWTRTARWGQGPVSLAPPPWLSAGYRTVVQADILPLLHENTEELRFSYLSSAFGGAEKQTSDSEERGNKWRAWSTG